MLREQIKIKFDSIGVTLMGLSSLNWLVVMKGTFQALFQLSRISAVLVLAVVVMFIGHGLQPPNVQPPPPHTHTHTFHPHQPFFKPWYV